MNPGQEPRATSGSRWVGGAAARDGWGRSQGIHSAEDRRFVGLAAAAIDDYFARNPVGATLAGDHRFDDRLPDYTADGVAEQARVLNRHLLALDTIDPIGLSRVNAVDLEVLRRRLTSRVYRLRTLDEPAWNPSWWSPALALDPLFASRNPDVGAVLSRLHGLVEHLESARHSLGVMPLPHAEEALLELDAAPQWLLESAKALARAVPSAEADLAAAVDAVTPALVEHRHWLASRLPKATRDPRLGARRYQEMLELLVGTPLSVEEIKRLAEDTLEELAERMRSLASQVLGRSMASRRLVPNALAAVAAANLLPPDGLVDAAARSVAVARAFTQEHRLVTVPDIDVDVVRMPAVRSGRVVAFTETPGALGAGGSARVAVGGPEPDWSQRRVQSFLREYNAMMLDAVMAHQAIPGHALQAAHAASVAAPTAVRSVFPDPLFAEGWAMYAQGMLAQNGYAGSVETGSSASFALQQVKLHIRGAVNALLDIGFHTGELDEPRARRLLATTAMAEEGEFVVKWRLVRTSAGSLTTYLLGQQLVSQLVADVQSRHPDWPLQQVHDRVLMHGAVPPSSARDLLGLI